jgi:hypothetical protein
MKTLLGLFFDDGSLALTVLVLLATSALAMRAQWLSGRAAMALLAVAIIAALIENVVRTAMRAPRR